MSLNYLASTANEYIETELKTRKARRPYYSLRSFARDLELSPSTLSEILTGKLGLSTPRAKHVAKKLNLSEIQTEHFCDLFLANYNKSAKIKKTAQIRIKLRQNKIKHQLMVDQFEMISNWHHLAILELIDMGSEFKAVKPLAKALKLTTKEVKESLERLARLQLIQKNDDFYEVANVKTTVGEDNPSKAIQKFHQQILKLAISHITDDIETKNLTSVLMSIRSEDIPSIKNDMRIFQNEIFEKYYYKENKDSLYCWSNQLFKITAKKEFKI